GWPPNVKMLLWRGVVEGGWLEFSSPGRSFNNVFRGAAQAERQSQTRHQRPSSLSAGVFHRLPNSLRAISHRTRVSDSMGNVPVVYCNGLDLWHRVEIASSRCLLNRCCWRRFPARIHQVEELDHIWLGVIAQCQLAMRKL